MAKNKINIVLLEYIEKNIFPLYKQNDEAHGLEHIKYVINRSIELSKNLEDIDYNMVYTIAAYHDIGHYLDRKNHETLSAQIMMNDVNLNDFFSKEEMIIMRDAIEDHRASLEYEPRSIYGKIVSSADREIDIDTLITRMYQYTKKHHPKFTIDEMVQRHFEHYKNKYGKKGYAKSYLSDPKYDDFIKKSKILLDDYHAFYIRNIKVIEAIENKKFISIEVLLSLTTLRMFATEKEIKEAFSYITSEKDLKEKDVYTLNYNIADHIYINHPIIEIITEQIMDKDLNDVYKIVECYKETDGSLFLMSRLNSKIKEF